MDLERPAGRPRDPRVLPDMLHRAAAHCPEAEAVKKTAAEINEEREKLLIAFKLAALGVKNVQLLHHMRTTKHRCIAVSEVDESGKPSGGMIFLHSGADFEAVLAWLAVAGVVSPSSIPRTTTPLLSDPIHEN